MGDAWLEEGARQEPAGGPTRRVKQAHGQMDVFMQTLPILAQILVFVLHQALVVRLTRQRLALVMVLVLAHHMPHRIAGLKKTGHSSFFQIFLESAVLFYSFS